MIFWSKERHGEWGVILSTNLKSCPTGMGFSGVSSIGCSHSNTRVGGAASGLFKVISGCWPKGTVLPQRGILIPVLRHITILSWPIFTHSLGANERLQQTCWSTLTTYAWLLALHPCSLNHMPHAELGVIGRQPLSCIASVAVKEVSTHWPVVSLSLGFSFFIFFLFKNRCHNCVFQG